MKHPEFDNDGSPTEATLDALRGWNNRDPNGCFDFLIEIFQSNSMGTVHDYIRADRGQCIRVVILVTGGWSDNEQALNNIDPFIHVMYWHQSTRGGMHTFEIPKEGVT